MHTDVAVIGYGPTGLVAASLLGQQGHRVAVAERWPALYGLPRFTHVDGETARLVARAADIDRALRDSGPTSLTYTNADGEVLIFIPASADGSSGFADHLSVYQPDIEEAIDERVRACGSVEVRQGWAVVDLAQDAEAVTLTVAPWDGERRVADEGARETIRARWVIAADGANSAVRDLLGVERDDIGFTERWLNFDAEWRGAVPERFHDTVQVCDPARGHMTMRIGDRRQRFEFALNDGEDPAEMTSPASAWALLADKYGLGSEDATILRRLVYTFESRVARQWRVGRVFLAGDAAHTMPPYLGQGACSGIRDAANLAWKLDLVLRERADARLLETYEPERRPHATALVHGSVALGRIANTRDPVQAAERDAAFRSGNVPPPPPMPPIGAGVLCADSAPPVGTPTPQPTVVAEGRRGRLDDVVGAGFLLISRVPPAGELSGEQRDVLARLGVRTIHIGHDIEDVDGTIAAYLDRLGADAYLARPDFVLFGTAPAGELGALVDELQARLDAEHLPAAAP